MIMSLKQRKMNLNQGKNWTTVYILHLPKDKQLSFHFVNALINMEKGKPKIFYQ